MCIKCAIYPSLCQRTQKYAVLLWQLLQLWLYPSMLALLSSFSLCFSVWIRFYFWMGSFWLFVRFILRLGLPGASLFWDRKLEVEGGMLEVGGRLPRNMVTNDDWTLSVGWFCRADTKPPHTSWHLQHHCHSHSRSQSRSRSSRIFPAFSLSIAFPPFHMPRHTISTICESFSPCRCADGSAAEIHSYTRRTPRTAVAKFCMHLAHLKH